MRGRDAAGALAAVEEAIRLECVDAEAYLVRGLIYRERDDLETARADLEEALKREPGYADALAGLGWIDCVKGDFGAALGRFEEAARLDARHRRLGPFRRFFTASSGRYREAHHEDHTSGETSPASVHLAPRRALFSPPSLGWRSGCMVAPDVPP